MPPSPAHWNVERNSGEAATSVANAWQRRDVRRCWRLPGGGDGIAEEGEKDGSEVQAWERGGWELSSISDLGLHFVDLGEFGVQNDREPLLILGPRPMHGLVPGSIYGALPIEHQ